MGSAIIQAVLNSMVEDFMVTLVEDYHRWATDQAKPAMSTLAVRHLPRKIVLPENFSASWKSVGFLATHRK